MPKSPPWDDGIDWDEVENDEYDGLPNPDGWQSPEALEDELDNTTPELDFFDDDDGNSWPADSDYWPRR